MRGPYRLRRTVWRDAVDLRSANVGHVGVGNRRERGSGSAGSRRTALRAQRDHRSPAGRRCGRQGNASYRRRRWSCSTFLAGSGRVDVALCVDGESGDLLLGRAVQHEAFALRRDAIDQPTAVGSGDQVAGVVEIECADLRLIALEEQSAVAVAIHTEDLAAIAGADIDLPLAIECQRPNVFRLGIEEDAGAVTGIDSYRSSRRLARRTGLATFLRRRYFSGCVRSLGTLAREPGRRERSCTPCHRATWPHRWRRSDPPPTPAPAIPAGQK